MKDQKSLDEKLTPYERWDAAHAIFIESLIKPDNHLRSCAYNQQCYEELMQIRDEVVEIVRDISNPHTPPLAFGKKNNHVEPTITTPNGEISETLMSGTLREHYMTEHREY